MGETMKEWSSDRLWKLQIEKRLNEIGSAALGNRAFQAERIRDLVEQIDELRKEMQRLSDRQDKIAEWATKHEKKCQ